MTVVSNVGRDHNSRSLTRSRGLVGRFVGTAAGAAHAVRSLPRRTVVEGPLLEFRSETGL